MVENRTLIVVGVLGTIITAGTAIYFATRKPKEPSVPGVPEEIPFEPSKPEIVGVGGQSAYGGLAGGTTTSGGYVVAPAFSGW